MVTGRSRHLSVALYKNDPNKRFFTPCICCVTLWLSGLLVGTAISYVCRKTLILHLTEIYVLFFCGHRRILFCLLPFLLSALAVYFSHPGHLYWICGGKAILLAVNCCILCLQYGQAAWLARWMFGFFDACSVPVLFYYWLRNLYNGHRKGNLESIILLLILIALLFIDYRIISPYASRFGII